MKRAIATMTVAVLLALPLTAMADDIECRTADIIHTEGGPLQRERELVPDGTAIRTSINGTFYWVSINDAENVSYEVPADADAVTVCSDGSVVFTSLKSEPEIEGPDFKSEPEVEVVVEVEDIYAYWQSQGFDVGTIE